jgi:hypothetical protein
MTPSAALFRPGHQDSAVSRIVFCRAELRRAAALPGPVSVLFGNDPQVILGCCSATSIRAEI